MDSVKITILQCEGTAEQVAAVLRGIAPWFGEALVGEPIRGELLTTVDSAATARSSEAEREAPAKPSAKRQRSRARRNLSLELTPRTGGVAKRVLAAFASNNNYPLPTLAADCYGDSTGESMSKLKQHIYQLISVGKLKRIGAGTYSVIKDE